MERRRMERSSLQAEVMQKVPELVVHERMSQGKKARGIEEKKKVKGWSTEEIKDKPISSLEEDTREMIEWRSTSQEKRWINVGRSWRRKWRKRFWISSRWTTVKEELTDAEAPCWNGGVCEKAESTECEDTMQNGMFG